MTTERDPKWLEIYNSRDAKKFPDDNRIKFTRAIWKAKQRLNEINLKKKEKSVKIIDSVEIETLHNESITRTVVKNICQSQTMSGKPCKFKANSECGRFCKKHSLQIL